MALGFLSHICSVICKEREREKGRERKKERESKKKEESEKEKAYKDGDRKTKYRKTSTLKTIDYGDQILQILAL